MNHSLRLFALICPALVSSTLFAQAGGSMPGKAIFEGKGACSTCHRIAASGSRTGPDLTEIGGVRKPEQLEVSILDPDAEIAAQNRSYRIVTRAGETITGRLLNIDAFSVQIQDSKERLRAFSKSNLKEWAFIDKSPMPSYKDKLNKQELADVVNYLTSLKGIEERLLP
jgi:putative heme-binding domain-containing protein